MSGEHVLLADDGDDAACERVLAEGRERAGMRICARALMPNQFHLVLWPRKDGDLSRFMQWLTTAHTQRWHAHRRNPGRGKQPGRRNNGFGFDPLLAAEAGSAAECYYGTLMPCVLHPDAGA